MLSVLAVIMAVGVAIYGWAYLVQPASSAAIWGHHLEDMAWAFYGHILFGPLALVAGLFQFSKQLRQLKPAFHRWCGRLYVACCCMGGVAGFVLAFGSIEGMLATLGFATLGTLWVSFTVKGFISARQAQFDTHRVWMIRSYVLTFSAVSLRLMMLTAGLTGIEGAYPYIAWLCWAVNLAAVEFYLILSRGSLKTLRFNS